jgi:hypothetical protein
MGVPRGHLWSSVPIALTNALPRATRPRNRQGRGEDRRASLVAARGRGVGYLAGPEHDTVEHIRRLIAPLDA